MRKLSLLMILSLLLLQIIGLGSSYAQDEPLKVVATYSILGDVVQNVAGDAVELSVLVGADGDAHTFEPTPQDGITLAEADLIFENGVEFETWLDDLYTASGSSAIRVEASEGIELRSFEEEEHDHEESHDHDHAVITDLSEWTGNWITTNRYADAPEMLAVYQVMAETAQRSIEEAQAFVDRVEHADFDALHVEGNTFTYITGDNRLTCTYTVTGSQEVEFVTNPITWYLLETTDANGCEAYHYVTAMPIHTGDFGDVPNFHIRYGDTSFDDLLSNPENAYWFATVAPEAQLTLEVYVASYQASAAAYGALMLAAEGDTTLLDAMLGGGEETEAHDHEHEEGEEHAHDHGEFDPHIWQNPQNVIVMTENVRDALIEADPANADTYTANAAAYIAELQALDTEIEAAVSAVPVESRKLVTSHDALGYFADRYGFEVIATVLPATTEATDPSAGEMAELIETIQSSGVSAVFIENVSNPDLMEQIADAAGVEVAAGLYTDALGEVGSEGDTYLKMMRYNASVITDALQ